jgi:hypothetical protein
LKEGYEVDDEWLFANVVPNIRDHYQNDHRLFRVLALAMLWGNFNNETCVAMQLGIAIVSKFTEEFLDEAPSEDFNPVQKGVFACS